MSVEHIFSQWGKGYEIEHLLDSLSFSKNDKFLINQANDILKKAESESDQAFVELLNLIQFINSVISKKPEILEKLSDLVKMLKEILEKIAEKKLSSSYNITAGFPLGISVGLSWDTAQN